MQWWHWGIFAMCPCGQLCGPALEAGSAGKTQVMQFTSGPSVEGDHLQELQHGTA